MNNYIKDDKVERVDIAMDIKNGIISEDELNQIIDNPNIKSQFFGSEFNNKKPQSEWTKEYLNQLSYAVVAESFNEDYLRYLYKVANFVNGNKQKNKNYLFILYMAIIFIAFVIKFVIENRN